MDAAPTTAYLMLGERCLRNCAFCAQARSSASPDGALSRVLWPPFEEGLVARAVGQAYERGDIGRACFQVTVGDEHIARTRRAVEILAAESSVPICASVAARSLHEVGTLLDAGAQRVTIALDAADEATYRRVKGGSWRSVTDLLAAAAELHPGRIGTHLIVGLGESEAQMLHTIQWLVDLGVVVALFAFTPVAGTALADRPPPDLVAYRRVQAGRWLIVGGHGRVEDMRFDRAGRLVSMGMDRATLRHVFVDGEAFRTSGCPDCNRPYYNERPGGVLYNYPRPLLPAEAERELAMLQAGLTD